jgi:hypothetical protein
MSKQERDPQSRNEQKLDSLLSQFFQQEMPEELRNPSVPVEVSERVVSTKKKMRQAGLFSIFAVTAVILLLASVVWKPFHNSENSEPGHEMLGASRAISDSGDNIPESNSPIVTRMEIQPRSPSSNYLFSSSPSSSEYTQFVSETVERYETPEGPVEQRNTFYTSKIIVVDPETGTGITFSMPELQIEILIDLDSLEVEKPAEKE